MRTLRDRGASRSTIREVTKRYVASARANLIQGRLIPRAQVQDLCERVIRAGGDTETAVTGIAGSGKSACVCALTECYWSRTLRSWHSGSIWLSRLQARGSSERSSARGLRRSTTPSWHTHTPSSCC